LRGRLGGFLPESNDSSIGLIPLRKNCWLEIGVRFPFAYTTGGRMRKLTKILCWPYGSLIRFLSIEKIEGYGIFFISDLFTIGYHNILWFDRKKDSK